MSNSKGEEPPYNKKEKMSPSPSFPLASLPDELALSCLARVSRSDYAALSLVSKRYRSLVVSSEVYNMRSLSGYAKKCFYVCLRTRGNSTPLWFMLRREKTVKHLMTRIPSFTSQPPVGSSMVALDWGIYVIGGLINEKPTSDVLLLDCRTHRWSQVPSMGMARVNARVGVDDGKIYVFGGCKDDDSSKRGEIFDPKTQTWDIVPVDDSKEEEKEKEEKVYEVVSGKVVAYFSRKHDLLGRREKDYKELGIRSYCCVTKNLLYSCDGEGKLFWRELKEPEWKEVKGLETLRVNFAKSGLFTFADLSIHDSELRRFGDNVMVVWFKYSNESVEIWCAEISFQRREEKGEIWGRIEWLEDVATLDRDLFEFKIEVLCSASVNV